MTFDEMTFDEFIELPLSYFKELQTILILKEKYQMELTTEERTLLGHFKTLITKCDIIEKRQTFERIFKQ
jgi:hypothetical protein